MLLLKLFKHFGQWRAADAIAQNVDAPFLRGGASALTFQVLYIASRGKAFERWLLPHVEGSLFKYFTPIKGNALQASFIQVINPAI